MNNLPLCFCGSTPSLRTSWTNQNPRRRFWTCGSGGCGYFAWMDPPMCHRSKQIIPGLIRNINNLAEVSRRKIREKIWIVICICLIFMLLLSAISGGDEVVKSEV